MFGSVLRSLLTFALCSATGASALAAQSSPLPARHIIVAVDNTSGSVGRFFDLSVGSDYPGTLMRDDIQEQLKVAVDELGLRYLRCYAIFHDVLGTVRAENGETFYNWPGIDEIYEDMLARHIKPFVELGFTPNQLATSRNSIFYW
jgi:xylan 1,4-beta-xylosidase